MREKDIKSDSRRYLFRYDQFLYGSG